MIQLLDKHKEIIISVIKNYPYKFYVFGSRSTGKAKKFSDLDLCIKGTSDIFVAGKIESELCESDLPFKVDVVLWNNLSDDFKNQIKPDLKPFS